jgi:hypothetical protein
MPGVKNANRASGAPATRPREEPPMQRGLKYNSILVRASGTDDHRRRRRTEIDVPTIGGKCWRKILAYRTSTANIRNEHPFLHSPSIIAIDEPSNSAIAIVLDYRVIIVNRLALREKTIVRGQDRKRLALQEEQH